MSKLIVTDEAIANGQHKFNFAGPINEEFEANLDSHWTHAQFDLSGVDQINSVGILKFVKFLNALRADQSISFVNVPEFMVNVMSVTRGIVSPRFKVESFYIPFYCAEIDRQEFKLFHSKDMDKPFVTPFRDADGKLFEVDTNLLRYLNFLTFQR